MRMKQNLWKKNKVSKIWFKWFFKAITNDKKIRFTWWNIKINPRYAKDWWFGSCWKRDEKVEAIIQSMTKEERKKPDILKASRKIRIAKGSGTEVSDVNKLLKQFDQMKSMMKMFSSGKMPNMGAMGKGGKFPF